jgi:hypothetical protein
MLRMARVRVSCGCGLSRDGSGKDERNRADQSLHLMISEV